jgi:hypothetical protein
MRVAKLLMLRRKRRGLMRERQRLHMEANGIQWRLKENERDAVACEKQISDLEAAGRIATFQERFRVDWMSGRER